MILDAEIFIEIQYITILYLVKLRHQLEYKKYEIYSK